MQSCLQSLPVAFGSETAKWICVGAIDITQLSVAGMLSSLSRSLKLIAVIIRLLDFVVYDSFDRPVIVLNTN